jgi:muramoyltetrapeptide carboxypeptidase
MIKWKKLSSGDLIHVVAPASEAKPEILQKAVDELKSRGFAVHVPENIFSSHYFHANTDEVRFALLKEALYSDAKVIWSVRGGYGANRLLPLLARLKKPKAAKLFVGISDVTSLHVFLNQKWGWPTLHASLLDRIGDGRLPRPLVEETFQILQGQKKQVEFTLLQPLNDKAKSSRGLKGSLIGGNLMTMQSLIGTAAKPVCKGKLLFLEELDERGYRVDRMLEHLRQAGVLKGVKGVLFGHIIGGNEPGKNESLASLAVQRFATVNGGIPMWKGIESGHDVNIRPLPLGTMAELKNGSLKVSTGVAL